MALPIILVPRGKWHYTGEESGPEVPPRDGVCRWDNGRGHTRYVFHAEGRPIAGLHLLSLDGDEATIQNVYVVPYLRRRGIASRLLEIARGDFSTVHHSGDLTREGYAWSEADELNKRRAIGLGEDTAYRWYTCCIDSDRESIREMVSKAKKISYRTMLRSCDLTGWSVRHGYDTSGPVTLRLDPRVGYFRSTYRGVPCLYLVYSGIEHIWVPFGAKVK